MGFQTVFKRYELKYIITHEQKQKILNVMKSYMEPDQYGRTIVRNIYFDTDNYRLIRRSIEKPVYKEKLRIRSYCKANAESTVFVELKKKYDHVVYKRRVSMPYAQAMNWLCSRQRCNKDTQISKEIEYCFSYYKTLHPVVFLSYEREAFYAKNRSDLRITFDDKILSRLDDLSLQSSVYGMPVLPEGIVLMEVKSCGGIPLWLTELLSKEQIYKTSFSKYGTVYKQIILSKLKEASVHV